MRYLIKTFGCRTNQAESFEIERALQAGGIMPAILGEPEVVIVNSCAVTGKAFKEVRQCLRAYRRQFPKAKLVLAGCAAEFARLTGEKAEADWQVGNGEKAGLAARIKKEFSGGGGQVGSEFLGNFTGTRALVKIQDGCDQFCAYCIVPYLRRRFTSRPVAAVLKEINWLVENRGTREVTLTGINLEKYEPGLAQLVVAVLAKTRVERVRFGSINVGAFSPELIKLYREEYRRGGTKTRLARHFHIPLQSGSARVLKLMNRPYTLEEYRRLVQRLKKEVPGVAITTDVIVGFSGETAADFEQSLALVKELEFLKVHVFRYSPRKGTLAWQMVKAGQWETVETEEAKRRAAKLWQVAVEVRKKVTVQLEKEKLWVIPEREVAPGVGEGYTDNWLRQKVKLENGWGTGK